MCGGRTPSDSLTTLTVSGRTLASVSASIPIALKVGSNTISIMVTSPVGMWSNPSMVYIINVTRQNTIEGWRQDCFGTATVGTGNNDDFNHNGVCNQLEYAFGIHPITGTAAPLQFEGTFTYGGTIVATGLPVTAVEKTGTAIDARMLFVRRKDALTAGLTYTPHFSADLLTWQPSYEEPTVLADDGTYQIVSVPYPVLVDGNKPRFSRLGVTLAP